MPEDPNIGAVFALFEVLTKPDVYAKKLAELRKAREELDKAREENVRAAQSAQGVIAQAQEATNALRHEQEEREQARVRLGAKDKELIVLREALTQAKDELDGRERALKLRESEVEKREHVLASAETRTRESVSELDRRALALEEESRALDARRARIAAVVQ
jgi:uncharacterized protein (DUF3084 family)